MRIKHYWWLVISGLILFLLSSPALALVQVSSCEVSALTLNANSKMLQETTKSYKPEDLVNLKKASWQPILTGKRLSQSQTVWWVNIEVENISATACDFWLVLGPAGLNDVQFFTQETSGWKKQLSGAAYPVSSWALPERQPVFRLHLPANQKTNAFARVGSHGKAVIFGPELWTPGDFHNKVSGWSLGNGMVYGSMLLLVLASLALSWVYRRAALLYMALGVGFYTVFIATKDNYLLIYIWPESPEWNNWIYYLVLGLMFAFANRYLATITQVKKLGRHWSNLFLVMQLSFALTGVFGLLVLDQAAIAKLILAIDQVARLALVLVVLNGWRRKTLKGWYAPTIVGLLLLQSFMLYAHLMGFESGSSEKTEMFATAVLVGGLLLLGTLISQVSKGRIAELKARKDLDQQQASEQERLETQVDERTAELDKALKARRMLLAHISHDLRSPLAGMLTSLRQWQAGDTRRDYPQLIESHAQQQMDMIDELLEFSRTELTDIIANPYPDYLYSFLTQISEQADLIAEREGIKLTTEFANNLPASVWLDFKLVRQILVNLINNAAKFTQAGKVNLKVTADYQPASNQVLLHFMVDDQANQLTEQERQELLLPFTRGKNALQQEGYGLGLMIVTQLLNCLNSNLQIDVAANGGNRFHFIIKVAIAAEEEIDLQLEGFGGLEINGEGYSLLVVDDQPLLRELTCDLLNGYGFDCYPAENGQAALEQFAKQPINLVITDQKMPVMDGWQLLAALKQQEPQLPVILYSGLPPQLPKINQNLSFDAYLLKPAREEQLLKILKKLLKPAKT